ncbi:MAG: hypothetical protein OXC41_03555 [Gammaproteobacteria bacterium]|nr:hypothetical protein [Gammaproteobacteria bacterium]
MQHIDARVVESETRFHIEAISDKAEQWLEKNIVKMPLKLSYTFDKATGSSIQREMLEAGMTLHVIEVSYQN